VGRHPACGAAGNPADAAYFISAYTPQRGRLFQRAERAALILTSVNVPEKAPRL
jgi:hypothetical protein